MTEHRNRQEADSKGPLVLIVGGHEPARAVGSAPRRAGVGVRLWARAEDAGDVGLEADSGRMLIDSLNREAELEEVTDALLLSRSGGGLVCVRAPRWPSCCRVAGTSSWARPLGSIVDVLQRRTLGVGVRLNRGAWEIRWRDAMGSDTLRRRSHLDLTTEWRQRTETRVLSHDERDLRRPLRRLRLGVGLPAGRRVPHTESDRPEVWLARPASGC
jgi:hypothetical protein